MPRKTKTTAAAESALPTIPKELIDQFVSGPMTPEAVPVPFAVTLKLALNAPRDV